MGASTQYYCDNCGDSVGSGTLDLAIQITAVGTNGRPTLMFLCTKPVYPETNIQEDLSRSEAPLPRYTGCARSVLTESKLKTLYKEVEEYTGDKNARPFML